ncbi:MAG: ATP-binding domain-containing protein [Gemmatimonadetes bacterium]|nr:ATP-binding domain-containing protein [Gemmatimonadota bacterium]
MSVDIVRGTSQKPVSSDALVEIVSQQTTWSGRLFIGYPIYSTSEGLRMIDALLVSADMGVVVFDLIEGHDTGDYGARQDDAANKLEARLKVHKELMQRRDLMVPIHTISFAPALRNPDSCRIDDYPLANASSLIEALNRFTWSGPHGQDMQDMCEKVLSAIEHIATVRKSGIGRSVTEEDSRGAKLEKLEKSIATLDNIQSQTVIETVEGVQRIRGLAGSGKTIVLALKAANLHVHHPDWRIAVTFNSRSLKDHFRRLTNHFFIDQTGEEPDWDRLRIVNAWGSWRGKDHEGIYHEFCRLHGMAFLDFGRARSKFGPGREFEGACEYALAYAQEREPVYDAIFVDEAQDLPPMFLRLCYKLLKHPGRLVYAYDELQSLRGSSLPSPEEIFGKNENGSPKVRFDDTGHPEPQRDIMLSKCYRNSKQVLATAFALGFGVYRKPSHGTKTGLVQMFDRAHIWEDIGYRVRAGALRDGSAVTLDRTEDTSPGFLEVHSDPDDLICFITFRNADEQTEWLTEAIAENLGKDELRHDDIMVINPDPLSTRLTVEPIRRRLKEMGIRSHLAGVDTDPNTFFRPGKASVTLTGVHRAKGNEAGMVYIINAQDCHSAVRNLASVRIGLFTAITRSKAWVRVLGFGESMAMLKSEYEKLKARRFELRFTYPTSEQREQLRLIHRDMTTADFKRLKNRDRHLDNLLYELETGKVQIEDLDEETIARFRNVLME